MNPNADYLFEVSWEICNKVGGIYTVVQSKARHVAEIYKNYLFIGPYCRDKAATEFEEKTPPKEFKGIFDELKEEGIVCYFGEAVGDRISTILIDFSKFLKKEKDRVKTGLWLDYKVDSLTAGMEFEEPAVWATAAGRLLEKIAGLHKGKKIVAHFHEWLSGAAILHLKKKKSPIKTVFTTHATTLGRTLTGNGRKLYEVLDKIDIGQEIKKYSIEAKHHVEMAAAQNSTIFTTVSEITGREAEVFLGRKPDILLPNGLDLDKFPTFEETSIKHRASKEQIKNFLSYFFFPYYPFDLENVLFYFIACRYEFQNKGIDVFIEALADLNRRLKKEKSEKTVIAFFWIPAGIMGIKKSLLESKTSYLDIERFVEQSAEKIERNMIYTIISKKPPGGKELFDKGFLQDIKKKVLRFSRKGEPLLVTHDLFDEDKDPIIGYCRQLGLRNAEEDRVKVVFYPAYLTGSDGLLDLDYFDAIVGCHLGVFPSYYEPWGYTPLESSASGVPAVATDLSGFGRYIQSSGKEGLFIINRAGRPYKEVVDRLAEHLHFFAKLPKPERVEMKIKAKELAKSADWKNLISNYIQAHNMALER